MTQQELLRIYSMYLPYGLEGIFTDIPKGNIFEIDGIKIDNEDDLKRIIISGVPGRYGSHTSGIENFTPILRPLSDLTKEIDHEGQKFTIIDYISTSNKDSQRIMRRIENGQSLDVLEFWKIERLLEQHVDIFGLIEKGLAVNKNDIK